MQAFMDLKSRRAGQLAEHPFIEWLRGDDVDVSRKFDFMPVMALFIMGFRDMNLWVIRFDDHADEHFRSIINGNTTEDETHSRLFLEDWRKLDLDRKLAWSASDTLTWLFLSPELEPFRRYQVEFVRLAIDDVDDPMLRFAHSEAGEACGHVFFRASVHPATRLTEATGEDYRYFGQYHLDRELGHVIESENEFEAQTLDPARRAATLELGGRMFDIFGGIFDAFRSYVDAYVEPGVHPRPDPHEVPIRTKRIDYRRPLQRWFSGVGSWRRKPHASCQPLLDTIAERTEQAARHPFYAWLQDGEHEAADKLRAFLPLWAMDILGYRDLQHYVFHYPEPKTELELLINRWVANLETHSTLFLQDWRALDLDERLGWGAEQTLEFCFLDPAMDVHRRNIFAFMKLGLRHRDPVLRFWLMHALERSGDAFFDNTRTLALAAEADGVGALDYLAHRHGAAHPASAGAIRRVRRRFLHEPLGLRQIIVAGEMIRVVFDALEEQLTLSLEAATSNRFEIAGLRASLASK